MSETIEVKVPDLGDFDEVDVIDVLVSPGDTVEEEQGLITLETEKAAMDVPAPQAGTVKEVKVGSGDKVGEGSVVAILEVTEGGGEDKGAEEKKEEAPPEEKKEEKPAEKEAPAAEAEEQDLGEQDVTVPDLGDFDKVDVIDVLVKEGDEVEEEQGLVTLETEKAAMDVPSTHAGTVTSVKVKSGDKVGQGDVVATVKAKGAAPAKKEAPAKETKQEPKKEEKPAEKPAAQEPAPGTPEAPVAGQARELPPVDEKSFAKAHASPSVRKFARELGVDLGRVQGSGVKGRITKDDVKAFVKSAMRSGAGAPTAEGAGLPATPDVDFSKFGEIERQPLSRIKKISGPRLQASWINIPHVTQHDEVDISRLEDVRAALKTDAKKEGARLTPVAFLIKAAVHALKEFPEMNSSLDKSGEYLIYKKYFHIGFAVDTPNGLVVPVIRDADQKTVFDVAKDLGALSEKARNGRLTAADMQGACFTISSLGSIGGTAFTPIVNSPEVGILGVSKAEMKPKWNGTEFEPRQMLPISLSYDHRVIDGAMAVRFTRYLAEVLEEVRELVL